ncbi:MAG: hypothetical protein OS112_04850 [Methanoregula sp.]|nr:MAG: hypothetical protein OS112_04850 [Methanoregula sp.]
MTFKENCKTVARWSYRLILKIIEISIKIARWSLIQIDRAINPRKYETEADRIERHRREDREHEIRMAKLNRETHHFEHQVFDGPCNEEGYNNTDRPLRNDMGFNRREFDHWIGNFDDSNRPFKQKKGRNDMGFNRNEFNRWIGNVDGFNRKPRQKKGRKPKDPWF